MNIRQYQKREPEPVGPIIQHELEALLTIREVARLLGMSDRSLAKLIRANTIQSCKIGGLRKFDPCDVRAFIEASKADSRPTLSNGGDR